MTRTLLTASITALALAVGGGAWAQMPPSTPTQPLPQDRSMNGALPNSELNRDGNGGQMGAGGSTMGSGSYQGSGSGTYQGATGTMGSGTMGSGTYDGNPPGAYQPPMARGGLAPADRVQHDRFGNVVTGNTCAQHWSNCAFDPSIGGTRNPNPQIGQAPGSNTSNEY